MEVKGVGVGATGDWAAADMAQTAAKAEAEAEADSRRRSDMAVSLWLRL